jgi:GNAT superfamily N-acetyltransferase
MPLRELPPAELDRVTHLDPPNQLGLIAQTRADGVIGEARYALSPDRRECEFAVSVADAWHGKGVGRLLLADLESRARSLGARRLVGDVLRTNEAMQALARKAGFGMAGVPSDAKLVRVVKDLALAPTALPYDALTASALANAA